MGFILSEDNLVWGVVAFKKIIRAIKVHDRDRATIKISQNI